jgi:hypothetical protein
VYKLCFVLVVDYKCTGIAAIKDLPFGSANVAPCCSSGEQFLHQEILTADHQEIIRLGALILVIMLTFDLRLDTKNAPVTQINIVHVVVIGLRLLNVDAPGLRRERDTTPHVVVGVLIVTEKGDPTSFD